VRSRRRARRRRRDPALDEIAAGRFEIHFPKRFTRALKLLRVLPYRWQLWAVRRFTGQ